MNYLGFISIDALAFAGTFMIIIYLICKIGDFFSSKSKTSYISNKEETREERSRRILGDELYESQSKILQDMIIRHKTDNHIIANITTCFGINKNGLKILTSLLPGDKIDISWNKNKELLQIKKYGLCIGHVGTLKQHEIEKVIATDNLTGAYIYTQNSYGMYPSSCYSVEIIVYHKPNIQI